jgi:hypothetical protein
VKSLKASHHFMELEGSSPNSQELSTCPYPLLLILLFDGTQSELNQKSKRPPVQFVRRNRRYAGRERFRLALDRRESVTCAPFHDCSHVACAEMGPFVLIL